MQSEVIEGDIRSPFYPKYTWFQKKFCSLKFYANKIFFDKMEYDFKGYFYAMERIRDIFTFTFRPSDPRANTRGG